MIEQREEKKRRWKNGYSKHLQSSFYFLTYVLSYFIDIISQNDIYIYIS